MDPLSDLVVPVTGRSPTYSWFDGNSKGQVAPEWHTRRVVRGAAVLNKREPKFVLEPEMIGPGPHEKFAGVDQGEFSAGFVPERPPREIPSHTHIFVPLNSYHRYACYRQVFSGPTFLLHYEERNTLLSSGRHSKALWIHSNTSSPCREFDWSKDSIPSP